MNKKRFLESPVIPAMVLFILSSIWHQSLWFLNDDLAYARVPIDPALWVIGDTMWSSRLLGETVVVLLMHCPILVWQMLDACMMVLFCYLLVYHAFPRRMRGIGMWGVLILALLFPVELLKTAGWCPPTAVSLAGHGSAVRYDTMAEGGGGRARAERTLVCQFSSVTFCFEL